MEVITGSERGVSVVTVKGDLDLASSAQVEEAFAAGGPLLADLCGVEFIDSYGLRTLLQRQRRAESEGSAFAIACPEDSALQRLLELVGTAGVFDIHASREQGLAALATA